MMHLSASIPVLPYSYAPTVGSLCDDGVRSYPKSNKFAHRWDIASAVIEEHRKTRAIVFVGEYIPITCPHGHHKMPKNAAPHEGECTSQASGQVCFFSSSVCHGRGEAQEDQTHQNKQRDHHQVVFDTVVLGVFFTLKCRIIRFFPCFGPL